MCWGGGDDGGYCCEEEEGFGAEPYHLASSRESLVWPMCVGEGGSEIDFTSALNGHVF